MQLEYKIIDSEVDGNPDSEFELNELGKEGWQLVGILPQRSTRFYFMRFISTAYIIEPPKKCDHQGAYTDTGGWRCPKCNATKDYESLQDDFVFVPVEFG